MKFQSLISRIMHGSRLRTRAALVIVCAGAVSGCIGIRANKHTYAAAASSPSVVVGGTGIRMQVKPEGTAPGSFTMSAMVVSAAVATFDGPFRWRLEAIGQAGKQQSMIVHRIRTRTSRTRRDEWYPAGHLGKRADFKLRKGEAAVTRAVYPIPGLLKVMPEEDGSLDVDVDLTITSSGGRIRKWVRFRMDPSEKRQDEFIFVPTEIVQSIGKSTEDWDDSGWD